MSGDQTSSHVDDDPFDDDPFDYDPFAASTLADPFAAYASMRDTCPLHRFDGYEHPLYTMTRYDDVVSMLVDVDTWSSHYGQMPRYSVQGCLFSDPPDHTHYRRLIQASLAPRHVAAMEDEIRRLVDELLDEIEKSASDDDATGRRTADLHDALACPLPVIVIAHILGVPPADIDRFKSWSDAQLAAANAADPQASVASRTAINDYLLDQLDRRRLALRVDGVDPDTAGAEVLGEAIPDDVISGILVAEVDGRRLDDDERLTMLNQLLVGGNETTTSLLTNLFWRLLERPELFATVRDDPSLDEIAVEESLRLDPPVLGLYRTNRRAMSMHGVELPERSKVMATYGAANRDPEIFDDPDTFRLDRDPAQLHRHVAFGRGHHFCPGAHLSRLETRIALRAVLDRFPALRLDGHPERIVPFLLWGRRTLPVAW